MLKLKPDPTFKCKVGIPVPGGDPVAVEFEYKHRTRKELADFLKHGTETKMKDEDTVLAIVVGWQLDDPFNKDSVVQLLSNYHGAAAAIINNYITELSQARLGN